MIDFNPTIDRIRITNPDDRTLAVNPVNGVAAVQGTLSYASGANPRVVGSAYTNGFVGASTTTLYDIDAATNTLATQVAAADRLDRLGDRDPRYRDRSGPGTRDARFVGPGPGRSDALLASQAHLNPELLIARLVNASKREHRVRSAERE